MHILNGIKNFLTIVSDNWTLIVVIIGLIVSLYRKIKSYLSTTTDEKIAIAKRQIEQIILKLITEAELDYTDWNEAGSIKRSQVIAQIYSEYPILAKTIDQSSLTKWIDEKIDNSLDVLRVTINGKGDL